MIYLISDIHGEYQLFLSLLEKINFSNNDKMFVLGDMIDKGKYSIKLLQYLQKQLNITCIMGNHEYDLIKVYHAIMRESPTNFDTVLKTLQAYFPFDGELLNWETIDWLESLPFYVDEPSFIGVHAGIPLNGDNTLMRLNKVLPEQFVYDRDFKSPTVLPKTEKCVFFGHTPTCFISGKSEIVAYKHPHGGGEGVNAFCKVNLDTGVWVNGVLGCFCVDNCKTYYISEKNCNN